MNRIQKSLTAVLALLLCLNLAQAQGPQRGGFADITPEERAEKQTEVMTERLGLDEEQAATIKDLNLTFAEKVKEVRDNSESRETTREAMTTVHKEHAAAIKEVLTGEQFQKWENAQKRRGPEKGKGKRKGKGKSPRGKKSGN